MKLEHRHQTHVDLWGSVLDARDALEIALELAKVLGNNKLTARLTALGLDVHRALLAVERMSITPPKHNAYHEGPVKSPDQWTRDSEVTR